MWILTDFVFLLNPADVRRVRSSEREWIHDDLIPHLWCQRTWWRHTPLCIQFTPTQGRIKYKILFLQIKFVLWQINLFWIFLNLFPFTFFRPTTDGLGSWNGVDWVSFFFFKFLSFRSFFRYFFPFLGFPFFLPLIFKITTRILIHNFTT